MWPNEWADNSEILVVEESQVGVEQSYTQLLTCIGHYLVSGWPWRGSDEIYSTLQKGKKKGEFNVITVYIWKILKGRSV